MRNNCFSFAILAAFVKVKNNFSRRPLTHEIGKILDKQANFKWSCKLISLREKKKFFVYVTVC